MACGDLRFPVRERCVVAQYARIFNTLRTTMNQEKKAPVLTQQQIKQVIATARAHSQGARNVALLLFSAALGLRDNLKCTYRTVGHEIPGSER